MCRCLVVARSWNRCCCCPMSVWCWSAGPAGRHLPQAVALRARIVLACDGADVPPIVVVARELHIAADTVRKWRRRCLATRLDGLVDEPRPGRLTVVVRAWARARRGSRSSG
ncbi:helix-turn-helix domain-containing protein [Streptomyces mauvecolor]